MTTTDPSDIPNEVPMFLRKTYHMIDSCDPALAGWCEDGETFVIKDVNRFEQEIIPQFFKHSKFSSFVRQLNFYSFRKLRYTDCIRLDPKKEAENANYWKFKHDNFQRSKPHLLPLIKRMATSGGKATAATVPKPEAVVSSTDVAAVQQNQAMKSEIDTLKKQLEEMNKNMSELTTMVQNVSLQTPPAPLPEGNKRKKVEATTYQESEIATEFVDPAMGMFIGGPDDSGFLEMKDAPLMAVEAVTSGGFTQATSPVPAAEPASRESSLDSNMTDNDFVNQLFTAFSGDDEDEKTGMDAAAVIPAPIPELVESNTSFQPVAKQSANDNRPDAVLMERLNEALALLPKEMQEQIVNRLIASITSSSFLDSASVSQDSRQVANEEMDSTSESGEASQVMVTHTPGDDRVVGMPLAAATLASLLSYYSRLVEDAKSNEKHHASSPAVKAIPVIPCHA